LYDRLEEILNRTKGTDYVVIMGDWNAVVGDRAEEMHWKVWFGKEK